MKKFKRIKYLIEYIGYRIFISILRLMTIETAANFSAYFIKLISPHLKENKIAKTNLKIVYSKYSQIKRDDILKGAWDNFGRLIGEFAHLNVLSLEDLKERITLTNVWHIEKLKSEKQPFFLVTGHLANWEITLSYAAEIYDKVYVVHRKLNNPYLEKEITKIRERFGVGLIYKGREGSRTLIKALKQKASIIMLVDQKMNEGVSIPFLGQPSMTSNAIAKLCQHFHYKVVPAQIIRRFHSKFEVVFHKPLDYHEGIIKDVNDIISDWVMKYPEQWFWFHKRWDKKLY